MIEAKQDCDKIIVQFQATKGALSSVYNDFLNDNLSECIKKKSKSKDLEVIIKQITK